MEYELSLVHFQEHILPDRPHNDPLHNNSVTSTPYTSFIIYRYQHRHFSQHFHSPHSGSPGTILQISVPFRPLP